MRRPPIPIFPILAVWLAVALSGCTEVFTIEVASTQKVSDTAGNFDGVLDDGDRLGSALANIGDLEGDGVSDLAAGAPEDDDAGPDRGAVWILFMDSDGQVDIYQKISDDQGGFTGALDNGDRFGSAVAAIDDLNGDGFPDLAVGAPLDDDGGTDRGAVWILFLNADGTVNQQQKISDLVGGFTGQLDDNDQFGSAVTSIGDLNNDGVTDLAVGVENDDDGGSNRGAVWILFMNSNGTVLSHQKISFTAGGFDGDLQDGHRFGSAVAGIDDLDGNGIDDLAVGSSGDDDGGSDRGAVWILFMNGNGTVDSTQKISQTAEEFDDVLSNGDQFGSSLANIGDINEDGVADLVVGADQRDDGGLDRGALWVLFMERDGTLISSSRISDTQGNFDGVLFDGNQFGTSITGLGDLNEDGVNDIATGANLDNDGGINHGAFWVLFMAPAKTELAFDEDIGLVEFLRGPEN